MIKDVIKTASIELIYQQFNEKYGALMEKQPTTMIAKPQKRNNNDDEENFSSEDTDDEISFKVQSLISPVESIKTRIFLSQQYEEIRDFTKTDLKTIASTGSCCFDRLFHTSPRCFTERDHNSSGIRKFFSRTSELKCFK